MRRTDSLKPHPRNAREHPEGQLAALQNSVRKYGIRSPLQVWRDFVIAGCGRLKVAERLGLAEVPTRDYSHLSERDARAAMLEDNAIAERARWNEELKALEVKDLSEMGADFAGVIPQHELDRFLRPQFQDADEHVPSLDDAVRSRFGDVWVMEGHRLICGDCTSAEIVGALLGDERPHLMVTDPPYGVDYDPSWREGAGLSDGSKVAKGKVLNDKRADWREAWSLFPGSVAYVWHGALHNVTVAESLVACGFDLRAQIVWIKSRAAISRGHYHWQHEPCQPAGTQVLKVIERHSGSVPAAVQAVPIESLRDGDFVVSYNPYESVVRRRGRQVRVATRQYDGEMYSVAAAGRTTRATDGHQFSVRLASSAADRQAIYLMRRGDRWRIGRVRLYNSRGFGLQVRAVQERADAAWILTTVSGVAEAQALEQALSCIYGIPPTHWETNNKPSGGLRTSADIDRIYQMIGTERILDGARRALRDFGRRLEYPLVSRPVGRFSRTYTRIVRACNLLPEAMELPVPHAGGDGFGWALINDIQRSPFSGSVYSLDVEKDQHYVADGLVTHNCFYAVQPGADEKWQPIELVAPGFEHDHEGAAYVVKDGKPAQWRGGRRQSTVWEIGHLRNDTGHGTQKPIECMRRPILNNSAKGDAVYEPFSGSGTTIAAAEQTGRRCFAVELDPRYVDVAVKRWQEMTGAKATRLSDGARFDEVEPHGGKQKLRSEAKAERAPRTRRKPKPAENSGRAKGGARVRKARGPARDLERSS